MRFAFFISALLCAMTLAVADESSAIKVLIDHCVKCHGDKKQSGQLQLMDKKSIMSGGSSGAVITPGNANDSRLIQLVQLGGKPHMPPGKNQLSDQQIQVLVDWINEMPAESAMAQTVAPEVEPTRTDRGLPSGLEPVLVIDLLLDAGYRQRGITPTELCTDESFVRRVYVDLMGRIPTVDEANEFCRDSDSRKRRLLVDRLLASDEHFIRMAEAFDAMLLGRREDKLKQRRNGGWHAYLQRAFREDRPWNQVAREILLARTDSKDRGHVWYLFEQNNKHQDIAERVARGFFGIDIACAQCHDHPLAPEIHQAHYWGLVGFYKRSKNVGGGDGFAVAESAIGGFDEYANALLGTTDKAVLTFLDRGTVHEERPADPSKQKDDEKLYRKAKEGPKIPLFSRRQKFVDEILKEHSLLPRAFVNRTWALLMGRGIVHPAEKMDSAHRPSHPELLDWLARDFAESGYNPRRLIRAIVLSRGYQLDSRRPKQNPDPAAFSYGLIKPMEAEAILRSLPVALNVSTDAIEKVAGTMRALFPDVLHENDLSTLKQTLALSNHPRWNQLMILAAEKLSLDVNDPSKTVEQMFEQVYGRLPTNDERVVVVEFLSRRKDNPRQAVAQVLWAVVTSAEFRFNH